VIRRVLRRLRREQSGFTLVELMVACLVGVLVLVAAFNMLDSSVILTGKVTDRVDRTQRARFAMEDITRKLRSQVCPSAGTASIVDGQAYSVKFYSFMGTKPFVPDIREIAWDTNTNSIVERKWAGTGTAPSTTWAASPTSRTLLTDVRPPVSPTPMFAYYGTGAANPFTAPLASADASATSKITISFRTYAAGRNATGPSTTLQSEVFARTADPNGSTAPECG
jgi:prepilin-type N-terminal cleavage/methylation domain-containing protein